MYAFSFRVWLSIANCSCFIFWINPTASFPFPVSMANECFSALIFSTARPVLRERFIMPCTVSARSLVTALKPIPVPVAAASWSMLLFIPLIVSLAFLKELASVSSFRDISNSSITFERSLISTPENSLYTKKSSQPSWTI